MAFHLPVRVPSSSRLVLLLALVSAVACVDDGRATPGLGTSPVTETTPFPCVHFKQLRTFLPETLDGLSRGGDEGSTGRYGEVSVSEVERLFTQGEEREVKVRILDTTLGERLGQAILAEAERSRRLAPSDPTAPIFWEDTVGIVRYDAEGGTAEASLLVGSRYVVAVSSRGFPGTVQVRRVARDLDLEGLARLQAPGGSGRQGKEQHPW
jgi:hypothetical protein